jgi:enoyl reductase
MSRAVVFASYGDADVLHTIDTDPPQPDPGQLRVRVMAAGVQPFDCLFRSGAAHQWMPARFPQRLGNEFAGVVDAVGDDVTGWSVGDGVIGWSAWPAASAEHVAVGAEQLVAKPAGMPWAEAGALSASGQTAATALAKLGVGKDDTVLIHAAAGGVGTFAVQLARTRGAVVIGTASRRNHDYLRSLGATPVEYGDGLAARARGAALAGVDAALDLSGTMEALRASLELVRDKARIGTTAWQPAADELGIRRLSTERSAARLAELTDLYAKGALRVVIQQAYPLEQAADAHRAVETGHVRGKIVLTTGPPTPAIPS